MIHCLLSMNYLSAFARFSIGDFFLKELFLYLGNQSFVFDSGCKYYVSFNNAMDFKK